MIWSDLQYSGKKEYVPLGTFWTDDWDVSSDTSHVTVSGRDRLKFLEETYFKLSEIIKDIPVYNLAEKVLLDAKLEKEDFYIDPILKEQNIHIVKVNDKVTHREMLRKLSECSLGQVYCDRDGIIRFEDTFPTSERYKITSEYENEVSLIEQTTDGNLETQSNYMLLDGNSTLKTNNILPKLDYTQQIGWISNVTCDDEGFFEPFVPYIQLNFLPKRVDSIKIVGDNYRNEYPKKFTVTVWNKEGKIVQSTSMDNDRVEFEIPITTEDITINKIGIYISQWSKANTVAKITEFGDNKPILYISDDEYFKKTNQFEYTNLVNIVEVEVSPLDNNGEELDKKIVTITNKDNVSKFGAKKFTLSGNEFIQTIEVADKIAYKLLEIYNNPNRNLSLEWRGNPELELGDNISLVDDEGHNNYRVSTQNLNFDGVLRSTLSGVNLDGWEVK